MNIIVKSSRDVSRIAQEGQGCSSCTFSDTSMNRLRLSLMDKSDSPNTNLHHS